MRCGSLRHKVEIQTFSSGKNSFGEVEKVWNKFTNAWADIKPIKASEYFRADKLQHTISHRVIIRYIPGIKPDMRIVFRDRVFEIKAIRDFFEKNKTLELMCEEKFDG